MWNMFKVNNKDTRMMSNVDWMMSASIVDFEQISHLFLMFLLLTLNKQMPVVSVYEYQV